MDKSLKQRIRSGEPLDIVFASFEMPEDEFRKTITADAYDLVFLDIQHSTSTEPIVASYCKLAGELGVPALLRIRHPMQAYLAGNWADLGPVGILIPMVDDPARVRSAIEWFYYPPKGRRSWGPVHGWKADEFKGRRREYADWWNENGILAIQIESVEAVENARALALPGVDLVLFGGNDLAFSLQAHPEHHLKSLESCWHHVEDASAGTGVRVCSGKLPWGKFEKRK